jgi:hypothetical protein
MTMKKKEINSTDYKQTKHEADFELLISQYIEQALIEKMQKDSGYKRVTTKDIKIYAKKDRYFIVDIGAYLWAQSRSEEPAKEGFIKYLRAIFREINKNIFMHGLTGREKEAFIKNQEKILAEDTLTEEEGEFIYDRVTKEHPELIKMVMELYKLLASGYAFSEALRLCKEIKK